jgi:glycosyltransferase involved in cell wall biosynthesis
MKPVIGSFFLYYSPALGGCEISQHNYYKELSKYYDIYAYCFLHGNEYFKKPNTFDLDGVHVCQSASPADMAINSFIKLKKPKAIFTGLLGSETFINIATENQIPVVHFFHGILEDFCGQSISRQCMDRSILSCPVDTAKECLARMQIRKNREKYRRCKSLICNSEFTTDVLARLYPDLVERSFLVYPNFDYSQIKYDGSVKENQRINILASNSSPWKGRDFIYDFAKKFRSVVDIIYADCSSNMFNEFENVTVLPKVSRERMFELYQEVNVSMLPAVLSETFSGFACESILSGTPVISSNRGNLPNLIEKNSGCAMDNFDLDKWYLKICELRNARVPIENVERLKAKVDFDRNFKVLKNCVDAAIGE